MKREIECVDEMASVRRDGSRFPAIVPARRMVSRISDATEPCFRYG